jgi:hypothetical protein
MNSHPETRSTDRRRLPAALAAAALLALVALPAAAGPDAGPAHGHEKAAATPASTPAETAAETAAAAGELVPVTESTKFEPLPEPLPESELVTAPWPKSSRAFPEDLPRYPMGTPLRNSLLAGAPGRRKDPELGAFERGRRVVRRLDDGHQFEGTYFASPEDVAQKILDLVYFNQYQELLDLRVSRQEYDEFIWPELPQSRPITNMKSSDGWKFHDADCRDAVKAALSYWGGKELRLADVEFTEGIAQYANFNLLRGVRIHAVDAADRDVIMTIAPIFAERNGRWKVYHFKE